jgi:hypothetical protein
MAVTAVMREYNIQLRYESAHVLKYIKYSEKLCADNWKQ